MGQIGTDWIVQTSKIIIPTTNRPIDNLTTSPNNYARLIENNETKNETLLKKRAYKYM